MSFNEYVIGSILHLHYTAEAHEGHAEDAREDRAEAVRAQLLAFRYLCSS